MLMSATFPDRRCLIKQAVSINLFSPETKKKKEIRNKDLRSGDTETLSLIYLPTCMLIFPPSWSRSYCWDSYQWQRLDFAFKSELYFLRSPDRTQDTHGHGEGAMGRREKNVANCAKTVQISCHISDNLFAYFYARGRGDSHGIWRVSCPGCCLH